MTHAGDPLANGRKGFSHCVSDHRFVLAAVLLVAEGTDKRAATAQFWVDQTLSGGAGDERDPVAEGQGLSISVLVLGVLA